MHLRRVDSHLHNRFSWKAFFVSGIFLLISPGHLALELLTGVTPPAWVVALFVVPGLFAAVLGLLGLYPSLANSNRWLIIPAVVLSALAGGILLVILGWTLAVATLTAMAMADISTVPPGFVFVSLSVTIAAGFLLFSLVSFRNDVYPRSVSYLLFGFAAPWLFLLTITPLFGPDPPAWFVLPLYGMLPVIMVATGWVLRKSQTPGERELRQYDFAVS